MPPVEKPTINEIMTEEIYSHEDRVSLALCHGYTEQQIIDAGYSV